MEENSKSIAKATVHINELPALKLAEDERVHKKFVSIFNIMHGNKSGEMAYEVEKFHFTKQLTENTALQSCSKLSLYGVFIDAAAQGLSFDPNKKLCYIIHDNVNIGTRENPAYEKRARLSISPYGELYLRQMYGQIRSAENPEVVYDGEVFKINTDRSGKYVSHEINYPRPNTKIIACYFRFVKADGTVDYGIMDLKDMERLKGYSERKNRGKANALYGGEGKEVDKGFLIAKTIKHAFKAYPKVKLKGQFSEMETETINDEEIDYELDETTGEIKQNTTSAETIIMTSKVDEQQEPVKVGADDDDMNF